MSADFEARYAALRSRDRRFDGRFFVGVKTTGIYCRPSCPAVTPKAGNVCFYETAAAAQQAGLRACLRCRPYATPGSPEWNQRADLADRAIALIVDGVIDREGVAGLARRLAYSERHLHRQLLEEFGAGPLALARAQRAQSARMLIETSELKFIDVAFAAGFSSVRQFNATIRETYGRSPRELRAGASRTGSSRAGEGLTIRLNYREPFDWAGLLVFFSQRAVPGIEEVIDGAYRRTLRLPRSWGIVELRHRQPQVECRLRLGDLRDLGAAVGRCRALLDLDADPQAIDERLGRDPLLAPVVAAAPGRRVPGAADSAELAIRAILGQQISVTAARTLAARLTALVGEPLPEADGELTHLFPSAESIAGLSAAALGGPRRRAETLRVLTGALAAGEVSIGPDGDRDETRSVLLAIPGVGPWTAEYIAMRALRDPDAFPASDLGVRRALERLGRRGDPKSAIVAAESWRPWRAYAVQHLWSSIASMPRDGSVKANPGLRRADIQ